MLGICCMCVYFSVGYLLYVCLLWCWVFVVCVFTLVLGICCMCVYFSVGYLLYVCLL